MTQYHMQRLRHGFTLMELSIVLAVTGIVLAAIWTAANAVNQRNNVQQATQQVLQILGKYKKFYGPRGVDTTPGAWVDVTCAGVHGGFFPAEMINPKACDEGDGSTWPESPWGQPVSVRADATLNGIVISYWQLKPDACVALASAEANNPGLIESYLGTNGAGPNLKKYPPFGGSSAMTEQDIGTFCAEATSDEVTFEYSTQ